MNQHEVSREVHQRFDADGFVTLRQFVNGAGRRELLANVDRFVRQVVPQLPSEHVFFEDKNDPATLKQIQQMGEHDPSFHDMLTTGDFRKVAEALLQAAVVPVNLQYFSKPPGVGRPTPPHQDGCYFMLDPCEAVTMWLALDDVDAENGCVRYVPGSHKRGMREHSRTQTLGFSQGIVDYPTTEDAQQEIALPARSGDLLVHDALTIHRADGNHSAVRSRRALGLVYYSVRAQKDSAAHAAYQRRLTDEMKASGRI